MKQLFVGIITILLMFTSTTHLSAQCGNPFMLGSSDSVALEKIYDSCRKLIEQADKSSVQRKSQQRKDTIVIPVVFNILYEDSINEGYLLEKHRFLQSLDSANKYLNIELDYIVAINDSVFHDILAIPNIYLVPAKIDPQGNPTDGFRYRKWDPIAPSLLCEFPFVTGHQRVKLAGSGGITAWNTKNYLNFWIGNLAKGGGACFGGQATYPIAPYLPGGIISWMDGIMMQAYKYAGSQYFRESTYRTLMHEVGHYLGLIHIWGGIVDNSQTGCNIDDLIEDTPNQLEAHFICRGNPNTCIDPIDDKPDMCSNVMDYTDGISFTKGQVDLMRSVLSKERRALVISKLKAELLISNSRPCIGEEVVLTWKDHSKTPADYLFPSWDMVGRKLDHTFVINRDSVFEVSLTNGYDTIRELVHLKIDTASQVMFNFSDTVYLGDTLAIELNNSDSFYLTVPYILKENTIEIIASYETDSVYLYYENECLLDSILITYDVQEIPTWIFQNNVSGTIKIVPNPAKEKLYIEDSEFLNQRNTLIHIYNVEGELKLTKILDGKTVDINTLENGMYFLKVHTNDGILVGKFLKQ